MIAVIDTGINFSHEVFTGKYDENGVKTDAQGIGKYDVLYRDKDGHVISKTLTIRQRAQATLLPTDTARTLRASLQRLYTS